MTPATVPGRLRTDNRRQVRRREGHYRLRSHLSAAEPAQLWQYSRQLTEVEQAFQELKGALAIRPLYHQKDTGIEAPLFIALVAYCLHVTLTQRLRALAPGLTPRAVLDQLATLQRVDVHLPTTDGRYRMWPRSPQPARNQHLILPHLPLTLPAPPPPRISSKALRVA